MLLRFDTPKSCRYNTSMLIETLAKKLGTTTHISPLRMKAKRHGLVVSGDLHILAVQRGCRHYWQGDEPSNELLCETLFSNAELALALLSIAAPYDPHSIRCGAAMLSAAGNDPAEIARLAKWERSEQVVRYVAECGQSFEPANAFWSDLLRLLPQTAKPKEGVMPHPTRFVAMSGYQRGVGTQVTTEWQRPQRRVA
jgi:hypothetical protein